MARQIITTVTDDLDGTPADETVHFGLDDVSYEIDLSSKNADRLRNILQEFTAAGTKKSSARRGGRKTTTSASAAVKAPKAPAKSSTPTGVDTAAVRAWAKENNHKVGEKGRIPRSIVESYLAATS